MTAIAHPLIVLIEDDRILGEMYVTKLTLAHYQARLAADGEAGLAQVKSTKPALVLLDLNLPKMKGIDVFKQMQSDPTTEHVPVMVLTNSAESSDMEQSLALGAVDYIIKADTTPEQVVEKIGGFLSRV